MQENKRYIKKNRTSKHFTVRESTTLLPFLIEVAMRGQSRTTIKQLLRDRFISVGDDAVSQFDYPLNVGDIVRINVVPIPQKLNHPKVKILWQDEYFVMISKDAGVPTVASGEEKDRTALRIVSDHLKKFDPRVKIFMLNRLDKDSAGLVLMAKSQDIQYDFISHWSRYVIKQEFLVSIEGHMDTKEGVLAPPDREDGPDNKTRRNPKFTISHDPYGEQAGLVKYRVLKEGDVCSLLFIELQAGRNNQLRRQFASINIPLAGDWRNGSTFKHLGRVALQGVTFTFIHPIDRQERTFSMNELSILGKLARMTEQSSIKFNDVSRSKSKKK